MIKIYTIVLCLLGMNILVGCSNGNNATVISASSNANLTDLEKEDDFIDKFGMSKADASKLQSFKKI